MELNKLFEDIKVKQWIGDKNVTISDIAADSRKVQKNSLFIAVRGVNIDGHQFIGQVIEAGASVVVCEEAPENQPKSVLFVVSRTRQSRSGNWLRTGTDGRRKT